MLYSTTDSKQVAFAQDPNSYPPFKHMNSTISERITQELQGLEDPEAPPAIVGALAKALCYINRLSIAASIAKDPAALSSPRILVTSVSPDLTASYIPIMNSIFSAQKLKVVIDACQIYGPDSVFLQQAAHLTGGSYICLDQQSALLQYLIMCFLPPPEVRQIMAVPTQEKIDFRAVCFCHKNIVDIAFVCSVCLSIFCQPVPVCSTCRTKFPIKTLQRLNASRPLLTATPSQSAIRTNSGASTPNAPSPAPRPLNGTARNGNPNLKNGR